MALLISTYCHVLYLRCFFLTLWHIELLNDFIQLTYKQNKNYNISPLFPRRSSWRHVKGGGKTKYCVI